MSERWIVVLAMMCLMTSCATTGSATPTPGSSDETFQVTLENAVTEATVSGASDAQIAILERSWHSGEISFEDAAEATQNTVDCLAQSGLDAWTQNLVEPSGLVVPGFAFTGSGGISEDQALALAESCERQEDYWVNMLFQLQPSSLDQRMQYIETRRPELVNCLRENGVAVQDDDPIGDLLEEARNLFFESINEGGPGAIPIDCEGEVGVGSY